MEKDLGRLPQRTDTRRAGETCGAPHHEQVEKHEVRAHLLPRQVRARAWSGAGNAGGTVAPRTFEEMRHPPTVDPAVPLLGVHLERRELALTRKPTGGL